MYRPVATVSLLLAVACEVSGAVAFEALFALTAEAGVTWRAGAATVAAAAALRALPGEVPCPVTLVAYARTHRCNGEISMFRHICGQSEGQNMTKVRPCTRRKSVFP